MNTPTTPLAKLHEYILEVVCRGRHKRGGPACQASCGIQAQRISNYVEWYIKTRVEEELQKKATA